MPFLGWCTAPGSTLSLPPHSWLLRLPARLPVLSWLPAGWCVQVEALTSPLKQPPHVSLISSAHGSPASLFRPSPRR